MTNAVPIEHMSAALDEIYELRVLCASEAVRLREQAGRNRTSQTARKELVRRAEALEQAARGDVKLDTWNNGSSYTMLRFAGAETTLNYPSWKEARGL